MTLRHSGVSAMRKCRPIRRRSAAFCRLADGGILPACELPPPFPCATPPQGRVAPPQGRVAAVDSPPVKRCFAAAQTPPERCTFAAAWTDIHTDETPPPCRRFAAAQMPPGRTPERRRKAVDSPPRRRPNAARTDTRTNAAAWMDKHPCAQTRIEPHSNAPLPPRKLTRPIPAPRPCAVWTHPRRMLHAPPKTERGRGKRLVCRNRKAIP